MNGVEIRDGKNKEDLSWRHKWNRALGAMEGSQPPDVDGLPLQPFGELTNLNTSRLILDSVGLALLSDIVSDLQDLLGTSCAVYERNGDYALSFCASGWCRHLALRSRELGAGSDNGLAPRSGRWHCHESNWNVAARYSMETGQPVDVASRSGLRLFAVPIRAGEEIIGSISVGYGDPPRDAEELQKLTVIYGVSTDELCTEAEAHAIRPPFVVAWAKKRVLFSARLIGEIVARKRAEQALREAEGKYSAAVQQAKDGVVIIQDAKLQFVNAAMADMVGYPAADLMDMPFLRYLVPEHRVMVAARLEARLAGEEVPPVYDIKLLHKNGTAVEVELSASVIQYRGRPADAVIIRDISERKRAEEALAESEGRFSEFMAHLPACAFIKDQAGRVLFANRYLKALFGWQECLGKSTTELLPAEVAGGMTADDRRVLREGPEVIEERITDIQGKERFFETYKFPLAVADGSLMLGGIAVDITERKRVEEALRESEVRFRQMVEYSPLPIGIVTDTGMIEYLNPKFIETFGYTLEDIPHVLDWFHLAYPEAAYRQQLKQKRRAARAMAAAQNSTTHAIEAKVACKDGSPTTMEIVSATVGSKVVVIFNDLTERKRAEEALQETNETLRTLIQAAPVAIIAFGVDETVKLWNPAAERMLGWREEEAIGKSLPYVGAETLEEHKALRERVLRGEAFAGLEVRRFRKDGSPIDMSISAAPLHDADGRIAGFMSINVDVTERKRAREERARLEAQMREVQKFESLGVLAGGIAHDFNNLLMAILGNADLALALLPSGSTACHHVAEITRASQRAADLCQQMLAYSGRGRYVVDRCDLSQIVREMAQILQVSISQKASLRFALADRLPAVEADATQMRQVMMNLVTNASEALGDRSGSITVSSGVVECDRLRPMGNHLDDRLPEGRYVTLEVSDTGCGMDADTLSKIFDPFFTTKFQGRGLGLAAALGIVRGHKGAIQVSSEPGIGTTVRVLLPALDHLPGEMVQDVEVEAAQAQTGLILLIDDDPDVRDVSTEMLTLLGFRVLTAADGDEGLGVFRVQQAEIDCVILDLTMPRMGGEETFRELQRLRSDVRVILSSGYHEHELRQRFIGRGIAGFIQKPYTVARLLETLSRVLH